MDPVEATRDSRRVDLLTLFVRYGPILSVKIATYEFNLNFKLNVL